MPSRNAGLIPVVQRSYDLCAGLYEHVNRFPRAQRTLLGRVILEDALRMLMVLTVANRRSQKTEALDEASGRLDALRITLRLSKRLGFLSNGGYESLSGTIDEVGRMVGGWLKYEKGNGSDGGEESPREAPAPAAVPKARRRGGVRYRMTSPIVEKYLAAKLAHPTAVVFVTAGAFCQTFFEDALYCGRELHLAVRDIAAESETEKIFTCGLPKAKLEKYVTLLEQAGREVVVE